MVEFCHVVTSEADLDTKEIFYKQYPIYSNKMDMIGFLRHQILESDLGCRELAHSSTTTQLQRNGVKNDFTQLA